MTDKTYDLLMGLTKYVLPALGTFYLALSQIWGAPAGEQVLGTVVALEAVLAVVLGVAKGKYNPGIDGALEIHTDSEGDKGLRVNLPDPLAVLDKDTITLKVENK